MKYTEHTFGPGETIVAIIKKKNRMDLTHREVDLLMTQYNVLNGAVVPTPGTTVRIPISGRPS